eukprot:gene16860-23105_t
MTSIKTIVEERSIYSFYNYKQRVWILVACGLLALLTPFTDTIYLPALSSIKSSLNTSDSLVAISVSAYLGCIGISNVVWGPLSDYFGRLRTVFSGLILYEIFTIGCIFATDITTLIVLRAIEGLVVGCSIASVQGIISDVFPAEQLGTAMGAFLAPMLVGPILAPLVGGGLAGAFGWTSTFMLLACMTLPIALLTWWVVPETLPWLVLKRINAQNFKEMLKYEVSDRNQDVEIRDDANFMKSESTDNNSNSPKVITKIALIEESNITQPIYVWPWQFFQFLIAKDLAPFYVLSAVHFAVMFTSLTILPLQLSVAPYNLSEALVGVTYLPVGFGMLLGAILGGVTSDQAAAKYPFIPEGRMLYAIFPFFLVSFGAVGFGLMLQYGTNIAGPLIAQTILGFGQAIEMPTVLGYFSAARPKNSASVGALAMLLDFVGACIIISISVTVTAAIGIGYFFIFLAGLAAIVSIWGTVVILYKINSFIQLEQSDLHNAIELEKIDSE